MSETDGQHFWKGEKEIVIGNDWNALGEEEKVQLIELAIKQIETSGIVKTEKSSKEYVNILDEYFQNIANQSLEIKEVISNILIQEIQSRN